MLFLWNLLLLHASSYEIGNFVLLCSTPIITVLHFNKPLMLHRKDWHLVQLMQKYEASCFNWRPLRLVTCLTWLQQRLELSYKNVLHGDSQTRWNALAGFLCVRTELYTLFPCEFVRIIMSIDARVPSKGSFYFSLSKHGLRSEAKRRGFKVSKFNKSELVSHNFITFYKPINWFC